MICALTVRTLVPGTFDQFREAFMRPAESGEPPAGFVGFNMIRNVERPDEVVCFGFFDGSVEELHRNAEEQDYGEMLDEIAPFVASVEADGLFRVVEHRRAPGAG